MDGGWWVGGELGLKMGDEAGEQVLGYWHAAEHVWWWEGQAL